MSILKAKDAQLSVNGESLERLDGTAPRTCCPYHAAVDCGEIVENVDVGFIFGVFQIVFGDAVLPPASPTMPAEKTETGALIPSEVVPGPDKSQR